MTGEVPYSYGILRYFHDIATGECVNVGVALFSRRRNFLALMVTYSGERAALLWPDMDREAFQTAMISLERSFAALSSQFSVSPTLADLTIAELVKRVLPGDDSSLKWGSFGSGLSIDPALELQRLFARMVRRPEPKPEAQSSSEYFADALGSINMLRPLGLPTSDPISTGHALYYGGGPAVPARVRAPTGLFGSTYHDALSQPASVFGQNTYLGVVMSHYPHPSAIYSPDAGDIFMYPPTVETYMPGDNLVSITTVPLPLVGANK